MIPLNQYPKQPTLTSVFSNPLPSKKGLVLSFEIRTLEASSMCLLTKRSQSITQDCYEIFWIKKGSGKFRIDMQTQQIADDSIVLLSPGQHFRFESLDIIEGYSIRFSQEFLCLSGRETYELFHSTKLMCGTIFPAIYVDLLLQVEINLIVLNMIREYSSYLKSRNEALQSLLNMLIIHLSRKFDYSIVPLTSGVNGELLKKFMLMVDQNFVEKKMVNDYASDLFVSPNYLSSVVKKGTGYSASYHIQQRIILEAKRLALDPGINMKEIGYKLGYEDVAHFSKFFKINGGVNFTNFRRQLLAMYDYVA